MERYYSSELKQEYIIKREGEYCILCIHAGKFSSEVRLLNYYYKYNHGDECMHRSIV